MADRRTPPADRRYAPADRRYAEGTGYTADHIAVRIKRGGGTGPVKPRQPPARERCQFHQAPPTSLGDVDMAASQLPPTTDPGGGFFRYAARVSSLQGMRYRVRAGCAIRLRALLRPT